MTFFSDSILAARNDEGSWILGLIVIGIWLISAIINAVKKQQEEQQRREVRAKLQSTSIKSPPAPARVQQSRVQQQRIVKPLQKQVKKASPPPLPAKARKAPAVAVASTRSDLAATEVQSTERRKTQLTTTAAALHRWMRPQTLRQQFILTEILRPPLALREADRG